jgi:hypothetical protein
MPVFNYEPYHNPYVQSMSALIQAQGQAQAEGALRSGQVWGNAIQGIGQEIGQIPGQIQAQKMKALQMQDIQGQIAERQSLAAERQTKLADMKAIDAAYAQNGAAGRDTVLAGLPGHLKATVQAQFDSSDKAHAEAQKAQEDADRLTTEAFADTASSVKTHNYDPVALQTSISTSATPTSRSAIATESDA